MVGITHVFKYFNVSEKMPKKKRKIKMSIKSLKKHQNTLSYTTSCNS